MTLLSIQDWIQSDHFKSNNKPKTNFNDYDGTCRYNPRYYYLPTDIHKYSPSIQDMKKPSELQSYHEFEQYCEKLQKELRQNKVLGQNPSIPTSFIFDEFCNLTKTNSEKLLEHYLDYIKKGKNV